MSSLIDWKKIEEDCANADRPKNEMLKELHAQTLKVNKENEKNSVLYNYRDWLKSPKKKDNEMVKCETTTVLEKSDQAQDLAKQLLDIVEHKDFGIDQKECKVLIHRLKTIIAVLED